MYVEARMESAMNLDLNEEQKILSDSAREFLGKECPKDLMRQRRDGVAPFDVKLWQKMADLGWMGVAIKEEYGGSGGDFSDLAVLLEAMGEACLPAPFFSTAVIAVNALQSSKAESLKTEFLPLMAEGKLICSFALIDPGNSYSLKNIQAQATKVGGKIVLNGTKHFVEYGHAADYFLTVSLVKNEGDNEGLTLLMVKADSPGVEIKSLETLDYADQCEVQFNKVELDESFVVATGDDALILLQQLEEICAAGKCAEILGSIQAVLEMSVSYVATREQFGQVIGSFQSVQHHCANMAVDVDSTRYITRQAIWKIAQGLPASKEVAMAKSFASAAAVRVCKLGHQTHGAISFCDELDMHLYLRKAHAASIAFGDAEYHLEKVAQAIGL